jgi:hypothetical protein
MKLFGPIDGAATRAARRQSMEDHASMLPVTFERWMEQFIDLYAAGLEIERQAAKDIIEDTNASYWYRGLWEKGISPRDAANDELWSGENDEPPEAVQQ